MTVNEVLTETPQGLGYQRTDDLCWFVGQASPIDDERRVLAQRMVSVFQGVPDVWVMVPEVVLPNGRDQRRDSAAPDSQPNQQTRPAESRSLNRGC